MDFSEYEQMEYRELVWSMTAVDVNTGCWIWGGYVGPGGYGIIQRVRRGATAVKAHRLSYAAFNGKIPKGLVIRHTCDVTKCVNPSHLLLGTQADNNRDAMVRGRGYSGEHKPKLGTEDLRSLRMLKDLGYSRNALSRMFKVSWGTIDRSLDRIWHGALD